MAQPALKYVTPAEYLAMEINSFEKNEYYNGDIIAMAGARLEHNFIVANIIGELHPFLRGSGCRELPTDKRVTTPLSDAYVYPDISIVCGKPLMEDNQFDTLTNPTVIIEVMSDSTRTKDKGYKFFFCMQIPSLREYILVDTRSYAITTARKQNDDSWTFINTNGLENTLNIAAIGMQLPLKAIYYGVEINDAG